MSGEIFVALFAANYLLAGDVVTLRSCCFPAALIRIHLLLYQPIIALLSLIDQAANTNTAASVLLTNTLTLEQCALVLQH